MTDTRTVRCPRHAHDDLSSSGLRWQRPGRRRTTAAGLRTAVRSERGDVPGWVMITLMTAAIVVALWAVASDQIVAIFENAMAPFLDRQP